MLPRACGSTVLLDRWGTISCPIRCPISCRSREGPTRPDLRKRASRVGWGRNGIGRCTCTKHCVHRPLGALGAALDEVRVRPQRQARVGVAEVLAHRLDRLALVKRGAGVEVTQGMAPVHSLIGDTRTLQRRSPDEGVEVVAVRRARPGRGSLGRRGLRRLGAARACWRRCGFFTVLDARDSFADACRTSLSRTGAQRPDR